MYITSHIMNNSPSARYIFGTILGGGGVKDWGVLLFRYTYWQNKNAWWTSQMCM